MSKHFELMQQIEKERVQEVSDSRIPFSDFTRNGNHSESLWASDEAQRLVQQLFVFQVKEPPQVVTFAGIDHGNGCSRICADVAETLAKNKRGRVCLVEANFRSPALPGMFGVPNHFGLTEALLRDEAVSQFAKPLPQQNLWLLSSGTLAVDSPSLLSSVQLRTRIAELRQEFDFVIVDAPPLNRYSDGIVLGQLSDGLVLVIEANTTRREAAAAVTENLQAAKVPILAAVLNKRTFPIPEPIYKIL
ncbi:CpsD/CapB family tyrosine-protein kinase [Alloacidobacterium dinghuense]|uniref:CpsD/CapB family tyrosine-protein kinase n=1 Tax=Alloacidobacterium dinghuense TaxID=2763107 RepID=A0A7G8BKI9_9BACT|nr:CpsD/CapB family tyrosine-protein kinase [Alloacidobacterium dinghuense]QNI33059.1 CpsD/CapB family tyrosine-protein kinase [Alloacidobacterium dinghuense]